MPVTFDKKWFNPLFFILNDIIKIPTIRTVLIYGGKSSAKTVSISQILGKECYVKAASSIAFRKESAIIPTTLKKSFNLAIDSMYLYPAFEKQDRRYLCKNQGGTVSEIVMKGLDDPEKAKGIESYKYVYLDELNHFLQTEFEQFNLSLRGIEGQKIFASWNPVDENSWVKTDLVDRYEWVDTDWKLPCENSFVKISTCGKIILIKTTYEDNYWITGSPDGSYGYRDENLIAEYEGLRTKNFNSYRVNVLGEWGKTVFGGEFLKCWKSENHVGVYLYDPEQAVYLYFDENVNPYFPCGFFQPGRDNKSPRLIHCIAAKNPNNKISWMCAEIRRKLIEWQHKGRLFIGGDATSQKEDVKLEQGHDMFRLIMAELADFKPTRHTPRANPSVTMSADFFNSILDGQVPAMSFGADKSCRTAILDFENTKEDKNGKIDKKTVTDPATGVSYQPYGHFCFVGNTMITTNKGQVCIKDVKPGNFVLTRQGFKEVLQVYNNGIKKVSTFNLGNKHIRCTDNHLFFTYNKGFKEISSLLILPAIFCIFDEQKNKICRKILSVTREQILQDTLTVKVDQKGFIIQVGLNLTEYLQRCACMFISTCVNWVKFLRVFMCTILMKTRLIMNYQTLNYYPEEIIYQNTLKKDLSKTPNGQKYFMKKVLKPQPNGISQMRVENGTQNRLKRIIKKELVSLKYVSNAEMSTQQSMPANLNTVTKIVMPLHCEEEEVFDLSVKDQPEYFANGVLVHNCDLTRYFFCHTFAEEYDRYQRGGLVLPITIGRNVSKHAY